MFSFDTFLESRYVALRFRGSVAVHFIGTAATSERAWNALRFQAVPTLPDFLLKLSLADNIRSVSFCHPLSLPQLSVLEQGCRRPWQDTCIRLNTGECQSGHDCGGASLSIGEATRRATPRHQDSETRLRRRTKLPRNTRRRSRGRGCLGGWNSWRRNGEERRSTTV